MALINIDSVRRHVVRLLGSIDPPGGVELLSYKRNRMVSITVLEGERLLVREKGYIEQEVEISSQEVSRLLKTIIKREFPRSRKVRLFSFQDPAALNRERPKI